jgi:hypothetical protein
MPKLRHGVGANCVVKTKFIHPSEHVRLKHTNLEKGHTTSLLLVGQETIKVNKKEQKCYTFRSEEYPNLILHATMRYVVVNNEGPQATLCNVTTVDAGNESTDVEAAAAEGPIMPPRTNDQS